MARGAPAAVVVVVAAAAATETVRMTFIEKMRCKARTFFDWL